MKGYGQYCPISRAAEIVAERWTPLIIRELLRGARHFSDIQDGIPRISPSLLSRRLKQLQRTGLVVRGHEDNRPVYDLTEAGQELRAVLWSLGEWGQRWMGEIEDAELDPVVLLKDIQTYADPDTFPEERTTVELRFPELKGSDRLWWLVLQHSERMEVCDIDPGHDIDLWVTTSLRMLTEIWLGERPLDRALAAQSLSLSGTSTAQARITDWFGLSPFAEIERASSPISA